MPTVCTDIDAGACHGLSNWQFTGMKLSNTDNCTLYFTTSKSHVGITISVQDGTKAVAGGSFIGAGPVTVDLNEVTFSGLNGSVDWDGTWPMPLGARDGKLTCT
jgi:hypothetical protein